MNLEQIAHYRIIRKLGSGGMGLVYEAEDTKLGRRVALKFLKETTRQDTGAMDRFFREARAASALNHPNIITIHDVLFDGDAALLVMEFVSGQTLAELIAAGPMPVSDVLKYAVQMADALAAAHDAGIVHRDLKPSNIMMCPKRPKKGRVWFHNIFTIDERPSASNPGVHQPTFDRPTLSRPDRRRTGKQIGLIPFLQTAPPKGNAITKHRSGGRPVFRSRPLFRS